MDEKADIVQLTSTSSMSIPDLKTISKKYQAHFFSLLLSLYGGGIRRFLIESGRPVPEGFYLPVAQPWPGRPDHLIGNHWNIMWIFIPLNCGADERLKVVQAGLERFYASNLFLIFEYVLFKIMGSVPTKWLGSSVRIANLRASFSPIVTSDTYEVQGKSAEEIHGIVGIGIPTFGIC